MIDLKPSSCIGHIVELIRLIQKSTIPADRVVSSFFLERRYLGARDRRFISEKTFGIFRHALRLEYIIREICKELNVMLPGTFPGLWIYSMYAVCVDGQQPAELEKDIGSQWNLVEPPIDCIEFCSLAVRYDNRRQYSKDPEEQMSIQYSFPQWMIRRFMKQFGVTETEQLCESLNQQAPITLRVNILKTSRDECLEKLSIEKLNVRLGNLSPHAIVVQKRENFSALQSYKDGLFEVQEEGSQIISFAANPLPGNIVIDACAGGGGKTLHLAGLMQNRGIIYSFDVSKSRLDELEKRSKRAGVNIVNASTLDKVHAETYNRLADVVLVDAPCSGSGTFRRNPAMKWRLHENDVELFSKQQQDMLQKYSEWVKPGGTLVYATCSIISDENDDVVENFLKKNSNYSLADPRNNLASWNVQDLTEGKFIRLLPSHHGTDGFFAALMRRSL